MKGSKNISIKMLKDVGMTVLKVEKQVQYIYAATHWMRAVYLYATRQKMRVVCSKT